LAAELACAVWTPWSTNDVKFGPLTATQHGELRLSVTSRLFIQFRLIIRGLASISTSRGG
jgi:hypothetical protein